jgi:riboflavin synthase
LFTGIVQGTGRVDKVDAHDGLVVLTLKSALLDDMPVGGSISVNGACLTAVEVRNGTIVVEVVTETLSRTALGATAEGDLVNLELPMSIDTLFDGHIVQGHVDATGRVAELTREGDSVRMTVEASGEVMRYIVQKGSITVDGVSLTVADVGPGRFEVAVIPHTLENTTMGNLRKGDVVNIEVDVLAKYVERLLKK